MVQPNDPEFAARLNKNNKVALALGGGGVRGLAHMGVLQTLERDQVPITLIVGTSIGSIVGAAYALHPDGLEITRRALAFLRSSAFKDNPFKKVLFHSEDVEQNFFRSLFMSIKKSYVFSSLIRKPAIFPSDQLFEVICDLIPDVEFKDTQIPFAVPAIDIRNGNEILITQGSLRKALLASCSLPGFFPPVEYDGMLLMDAGVISPVPVSFCRRYHPKVLVAVDITNQFEPVTKVGIGLEAILAVEAIAGRRINQVELSQADVVIRPEVGYKAWSDFSDFEQLVDGGVQAGKAAVAKVRALLSRRALFWKSGSASI
ncbi:MAG: patatin-like phospholipase family protein [Planctomycetes bacterium]|nr:patatin-like phospholipase family protein [Planctomycetota bacterium]